MSRADYRHYPIVFGAKDNPNKGILEFEKDGHIEIHIGEVKEGYDYGDSFDIDDFTGEYAELWFCKKESLLAFRDVIDKALDMWDEKGE